MTVKSFLETSFSHAGLNWEDHVKFDERYLRPAEVDALIGDPSKAKVKLGWQAEVSPEELAKIMVDYDRSLLDGASIDCPHGSLWEKEAR